MLTYFKYHIMIFRILRKSLVVLPFITISTSCSKSRSETPAVSGTASSNLTMLLNESVALQGNPIVYNFKVTTSAGQTVDRGGDLPASGSALTIYDLPSDPAATITASLYTLNIEPRFQTHACSATAPVKLEPGLTASIALDCLAVTPGGSSELVRLFLKIAKASVSIAEADSQLAIKQRDLEAPIVFSHLDSRKRRITIKQTTHGLAFNLGGEIGYYAAKTTGSVSLINQLIEGGSIEMTATSGSLLQSIPEAAVLKLTGAPMLYEAEDGTLKIALPFELNNTAGTAGFDGTLFEEGSATEFTVVSYNVENLFDQVDEDRNASYGDYRMTPNTDGKSSNYADSVEFNSTMMNFTQIKIEGIRRALQAIDPAGPEVVGLVEIESRAALEMLLNRVSDLGYTAAEFSDWLPGTVPNAIGMGLISKYPVKAKELVTVSPIPGPVADPDAEPTRPILKVTLDINGHDLIVYVNHWKSKGGPESKRILSAQALQADLKSILDINPRTDYIILGDLNSNYNETTTIEDRNNDSNNQTGINQILNAQGDELKAAKLSEPYIKYNLHYELDRAARKTAWHFGFGWSSLDNMIVGAGLYDMIGITYVDNSFEVAASHQNRFDFLFNEDGTTNRWKQVRESNVYTRHEAGGYSDHLPIFARFRIATVQDSYTIPLYRPGKPDNTDAP